MGENTLLQLLQGFMKVLILPVILLLLYSEARVREVFVLFPYL
jgi:hypothetical protein